MAHKFPTPNCDADSNEENQCTLENFLIVWLDPNISKIEKDTLTSTKARLRRIVNHLRIFNRPNPCFEYINGIVNEKVLLILSVSLHQQMIPLVSELDQVLSIYLLFGSTTHKISVNEQYQHKIVGSFVDISSICKHLKEDIWSLSNNLVSMNVFTLSKSRANGGDDRRDESLFATAQFILHNLVTLDENDDSRKKYIIDKCRLEYRGNDDQLKLIEEFEKDYHPNQAIWWYTRSSFLTNIISKAVRIPDNDMQQKLQFFIVDLHQQLKQVHSQIEPTVVYRGQNLSNEQLDKLKSNVGGLLLIGDFFLANICKESALSTIHRRVNAKSVLFQIEIDPAIDANTPFASVQSFSYSQKEEVLFSIGSVFRIKTISKIRNGIWNIVLLLCGKEDEQLKEIIGTMKKALLSKAVGTRVTDKNRKFYLSMYLNDIGKIYDNEKKEFTDAITLNFDQVKNEPKMILNIEDAHTISVLCPSSKLLLCYCSNGSDGNIYLINRDGNIHRTEWTNGWIYDICWSPFLKKFIIVSDSPAFSFYTYDENTNEIQRVERKFPVGKVKFYANCRSYLNIFSIAYHNYNTDLEIYHFNLKNWNTICDTYNEEALFDMRFSVTNYIYLGVVKRDWSKPKEESGHWRFELRNVFSTSKMERKIQLDDRMKSPCTVPLSNLEWLVYDTETKLISLIDRTVKSQKIIEYDGNIRNATLMDQNCLVILTDNNQLHFHDL